MIIFSKLLQYRMAKVDYEIVSILFQFDMLYVASYMSIYRITPENNTLY